LTAFLDTWPGAFGNGATLADAIIRYWAGDANGAAFIVVPAIEAVARYLVLATDTGIYRLQKNQTRGSSPASARYSRCSPSCISSPNHAADSWPPSSHIPAD
jgi:hypothetical protein